MFAIQFNKLGFRTIGIDFDEEAIKIANQLNEKENTSAEFYVMDVANWKQELPSIDIAICFDIFEHLYDDEIGSLLYILSKQLLPKGCIIFHTLPL